MSPATAIKMPHGTKRAAQRYADFLTRERGVRYLVFRVPPGTRAYELGSRFNVCREDEREVYAAGGAIFVDA